MISKSQAQALTAAAVQKAQVDAFKAQIDGQIEAAASAGKNYVSVAFPYGLAPSAQTEAYQAYTSDGYTVGAERVDAACASRIRDISW